MKPNKYLLVLMALALGACVSAAPPDTAANAPKSGLHAPDVRYEPTPQPVVEQMLAMANIHAGDVVYDLGSGDGRIPITAVRTPGVRAVGIDIDPVRIAESNANAQAAGVTDRVTFRNEDLFAADFRDATVVTLFLYPDLNLRLKPRLLKELRPGTRIVSYWHDMGKWKPERTVKTELANIYLWTIPPRR